MSEAKPEISRRRLLAGLTAVLTSVAFTDPVVAAAAPPEPAPVPLHPHPPYDSIVGVL